MDPASYPDWAQQLIEDCRESKRRVVEHEFYQRLRDGQLRPATVRQYLIGGWPVVEQFSLYMAHNLTKTRYGRHAGEDMARRWLMRNIRVELNHADYWVHWCQAHGIHLHELQAQEVPPELNGLNDWCWRVCATESLAIAMAATNYAIEGATGEWSAVVCAMTLTPKVSRRNPQARDEVAEDARPVRRCAPVGSAGDHLHAGG
jgi:pyrroloquinoline quinone (PQQ) biosynthesis protein C